MHLAVRLFTWCWITPLIFGGTQSQPPFLLTPGCVVCRLVSLWRAARLSLPVEIVRPAWPTFYWRYPTSCGKIFIFFFLPLDCGLSALRICLLCSANLNALCVCLMREFFAGFFATTYVDSQLRPRVVGTTFTAPSILSL